VEEEKQAYSLSQKKKKYPLQTSNINPQPKKKRQRNLLRQKFLQRRKNMTMLI
jgi:hypothetical protein